MAGESTVRAEGEKVVEQIFAGSLAILSILIAVIGLVIAAQDKVEGVDYLENKLERLQLGVVAVSGLAGVVAILSLERMRGQRVPLWMVTWGARLLIVGPWQLQLGSRISSRIYSGCTVRLIQRV